MAQPPALDHMRALVAGGHAPPRQPPPPLPAWETLLTLPCLATLGGAQPWGDSPPPGASA